MLLWIILFIIIVAISLLLAFQSMKDFQIAPPLKKAEYALFLIKTPQNLTTQILQSIYTNALEGGHIISIERLFKGSKSALVIFGPKLMLQKFNQNLNLVELEEYSDVNPNLVLAWEVGIKSKNLSLLDRPLSWELPPFLETEQFWWQLLLQADKNGQFKCQIRAVLVTEDKNRRLSLQSQLEEIDNVLTKLPRPYSSGQILSLYQKRSRWVSNQDTLVVSQDEILKLSGVKKA